MGSAGSLSMCPLLERLSQTCTVSRTWQVLQGAVGRVNSEMMHQPALKTVTHSELSWAFNLDQPVQQLVWQAACLQLTVPPLHVSFYTKRCKQQHSQGLAVGLLLLLCSSTREEHLLPWEQLCTSMHPSFGEICLEGTMSRWPVLEIWTVLNCSRI